MVLLVTLLSAFIVCGALVATLLWVKTPIYRVKRADIRRLLEWVLLGQATENNWRVFCDYPIRHDELLESIRMRCEKIEEDFYSAERHAPYLFTPMGLEAIRQQLVRLEIAPASA